MLFGWAHQPAGSLRPPLETVNRQEAIGWSDTPEEGSAATIGLPDGLAP